MIVYVERHDLAQDAPPVPVQLDGVPTVADVWSRLDLQSPAPRGTGALTPLVVRQATGLAVLVNGRLATWQTELQDGDVVRLIAVPGGG